MTKAATRSKKKQFSDNNVTEITRDVAKGSKKKFSQHDFKRLQPRNDRQRKMIDAYNDPDVEFIIALGTAGAGKTSIAMSEAIQDVLDGTNGRHRIIVVRSAVDTREIGFRPGSEEEKVATYEEPFINVCNDLCSSYNSMVYQNMKECGRIEFRTTNCRGLNFRDAVIIIDEIQCMTYEEIRTIIGRADGIDCKIIACGDFRQNDLTKRKNDVSGLAKFMDVMKGVDQKHVCHVEFLPEDNQREGPSKKFLIADYEYTGDK